MRKSNKRNIGMVFDDAANVLVRILAGTDSVWLPLRNWNRPIPTNVHEGRELFRLAGVPWTSAATTEAGRKSSQRQLEALADDGRVLVCRPTSHRAVCVRLTDQTEAATRALCGMPGMYGAWLAMTKLSELGGHASEFEMTDRSLWPHDQIALENMLLPMLNRELVISNSTIHGEVRYSITPAGEQWLAESSEHADHPGAINNEAAEVYSNYVVAALNRLETMKPKSTRELGLLPSPVGAHDSKINCSLPAFRRK